MIRVITLKEICQLLHVSNMTLYKLRVKDPTFPKPILGTNNHLRFDYNQVEQWYQERLNKLTSK